jgi:DNA-binding MarR family transcriptional regulator
MRPAHKIMDVSSLPGDDAIDSSYEQSVSSIHNRLFFRVFQVGNTLERQATKELGITSVQWSVLGALSRPKVSEGMPFSELAEYLGVSRQNLDGVLKRLERDEHVRRIADPVDRRAKLVILTPIGRDFWNTVQPKIYEFYRQALADFRFDDKVSFVHYLNRLNEGMKTVSLGKTASKNDDT